MATESRMGVTLLRVEIKKTVVRKVLYMMDTTPLLRVGVCHQRVQLFSRKSSTARSTEGTLTLKRRWNTLLSCAREYHMLDRSSSIAHYSHFHDYFSLKAFVWP